MCLENLNIDLIPFLSELVQVSWQALNRASTLNQIKLLCNIGLNLVTANTETQMLV